jgi:hypothetical protein
MLTVTVEPTLVGIGEIEDMNVRMIRTAPFSHTDWRPSGMVQGAANAMEASQKPMPTVATLSEYVDATRWRFMSASILIR